jgi:hypothetical protein
VVVRRGVTPEALWYDYIFGKQSLAQLSARHKVSVSSVQRQLKKQGRVRIISADKEVVVLVDCTYWGRSFGVVVFKDAHRGKILWRKFVRYETLFDYREGVEWLERHGFKINGVVCDGLRGMFSLLGKYRVQMCQYHQVKIVRRYLTQQPDLPAAKELLGVVKLLTRTDKESFVGAFEGWVGRWSDFLKERSVDRRTKKTYYTHKRLRSAYLSLRRNMPFLWAFYDHPDAGIPNTNNGLEGQFSDLKSKLRNHSGLSREHRKMFIDEYFRNTFR